MPAQLTFRQVSAIHLGKVRLCQAHAIKQVTMEDGSKKHVPIDPDDKNAVMTCQAIDVLEDLIAPYGYRFGETSGAELLKG